MIFQFAKCFINYEGPGKCFDSNGHSSGKIFELAMVEICQIAMFDDTGG